MMTATTVALASGAQAEAQAITHTPYTITQPGRYYVTGDVNTPTPILNGGIGIVASNVVLDLNGWAIPGPITIYQSFNVTVENGSFSSAGSVLINTCSFCTVRNISGYTIGVAITDVNGKNNRIVDNNISSVNGYGVYLNQSSLSVVENNQISSGLWGVVATGSYAMSVKGNTIAAPYGIYMPNQYGAHLDNTFAGGIAIKVYGEPTATN
jgi:parallel beta-helix repeat protein